MRSPRIRIADGVFAGGGAPLLLIAGPDSIESEAHALKMAAALRDLAAERGMPLVYKSSFDKANRTSAASFRGVGLEEGLRILARVKKETGLPVTTDFHTPEQAARLAPVVDLLQVPAMLSRQTDMLQAAARTGRAVNVKKGQFLAPWDAEHVVLKVRGAGCENILLTERGVTFGYNALVVDFRSLPRLRALGVPVCFDATHSVQLPGGQGHASGGERQFIAPLARAAVAVGVDALFFEVHDDPDRALCDGPSQMPLAAFPAILDGLLALDRAAREHPLPPV
ncbi:MAG TPA: 3-deoxy-8-phosphooctulonate synthase [Candidatus Sulfotelmatobacter sp.]|jgi:2-dehydro-3-deoxyphosphooctonate aldolase (KDO 8-P synthase)|nr:3-deoxy-8-phosphooctulonate synthase [Candidatus Sulfotelmatobacter sp.]